MQEEKQSKINRTREILGKRTCKNQLTLELALVSFAHLSLVGDIITSWAVCIEPTGVD